MESARSAILMSMDEPGEPACSGSPRGTQRDREGDSAPCTSSSRTPENWEEKESRGFAIGEGSVCCGEPGCSLLRPPCVSCLPGAILGEGVVADLTSLSVCIDSSGVSSQCPCVPGGLPPFFG